MMTRTPVTCLAALTDVDVGAAMSGSGGTPRAGLFVQDGLQMTATGYEIWNEMVRDSLDRILP